MDMRTAFPSRFFRADEFDGTGRKFTIGQIINEVLQGKAVPVMYFRGQEKGLVLNQQLNNVLMGLPGFGYESNAWTGKEIILFSYNAIWNNQPKLRIGVRAANGSAPVAAPVQIPQRTLKEEMNDEVPF